MILNLRLSTHLFPFHKYNEIYLSVRLDNVSELNETYHYLCSPTSIEVAL